MKRKKINNEQSLIETYGDLNDFRDYMIYNRLTCTDAEKEFGICKRFLSKYAKENNWGIKPSWSQQRNCYESYGLNKNQLYEDYIIKEKSLRQIANEFNIPNHETIKMALIFYNVITEASEVRPFNYDKYYDSRRTLLGETRKYRAIMTKYLNRPLTESEVVHHIDRNRENNDLSNLFLFENEYLHSQYHGYIKTHDYITPQQFLDDIVPIFKNTLWNKDWLYEQYIKEHKSMAKIAQECEVARQTVKLYLEQYNILELRPMSTNQFD